MSIKIDRDSLRAAALATKQTGNGLTIQIDYDKTTGIIYTAEHAGQSYTEYHHDDIIYICTAKLPLTQKQIADEIKIALEQNF